MKRAFGTAQRWLQINWLSVLFFFAAFAFGVAIGGPFARLLKGSGFNVDLALNLASALGMSVAAWVGVVGLVRSNEDRREKHVPELYFLQGNVTFGDTTEDPRRVLVNAGFGPALDVTLQLTPEYLEYWEMPKPGIVQPAGTGQPHLWSGSVSQDQFSDEGWWTYDFGLVAPDAIHGGAPLPRSLAQNVAFEIERSIFPGLSWDLLASHFREAPRMSRYKAMFSGSATLSYRDRTGHYYPVKRVLVQLTGEWNCEYRFKGANRGYSADFVGDFVAFEAPIAPPTRPKPPRA